MGESSVGAVQQPGRPLGPLQRLVDRQPVSDQPGEDLADQLAVGTHHRVLQPGILKQRQDPGEIGVHTQCHLVFDAEAAVVGEGLHGLVAAEGGTGQDAPDGVVIQADDQPGGFGLAGQREGPSTVGTLPSVFVPGVCVAD
jgi:hypothetical protein